MEKTIQKNFKENMPNLRRTKRKVVEAKAKVARRNEANTPTSIQKSGNQKFKTSQELRMLSNVTLYCQLTKIVMKPLL